VPELRPEHLACPSIPLPRGSVPAGRQDARAVGVVDGHRANVYILHDGVADRLPRSQVPLLHRAVPASSQGAAAVRREGDGHQHLPLLQGRPVGLPPAGLTDPDEAVPAPGRQTAPVRAEHGPVDGGVMPDGGTDRPPSSRVPEAGGLIDAPGQDVAAVRAEAGDEDRLVMAELRTIGSPLSTSHCLAELS
jgi:hypothetical protein